VVSLALVFLLGIVLPIWGLLCFYMNMRIFKKISVKNGIAILMGILFSLWTASSKKALLTILSLLAHEHRMSLHLLVSSSISSVFHSFYFSDLSMLCLGVSLCFFWKLS
jgi:hypothetical protein